jgi:hypothetical protein
MIISFNIVIMRIDKIEKNTISNEKADEIIKKYVKSMEKELKKNYKI